MDIKQIFDKMRDNGMVVPSSGIKIAITGAKENFDAIMQAVLEIEGIKYEKLPEYAEIMEWMEDNGGKGILIYGNCGTGKTLIARYVFPALMLNRYGKIVKCYDAYNLLEYIDEIMKQKILAIDDIGTEDIVNQFGTKRMVLAEIIDKAEKAGNLLFLTSNLDANGIKSKYGERIYDRIIKMTHRIVIAGKSKRR